MGLLAVHAAQRLIAALCRSASCSHMHGSACSTQGTASDSCCPQIDLLQHDISQLQQPSRALWADVVIMNPPFGTRRKGADLEFLRAAFQVGSAALDPACCAAALHSTCACNSHYAHSAATLLESGVNICQKGTLQ